METENSSSGVPDKETKKQLYEKACKEIQTQLSTLEKGIIIPRMATISAVMKHYMPHYLWCGFYFAEEKEMIAGPYQGTIACPNIAYTGVCGKAAKEKKTVIVPDVEKFPGHIVCDERSSSEIVVPIIDKAGRLIAVFDVDSSHVNAFDETDQEFLEKLMPILLEGELV